MTLPIYENQAVFEDQRYTVEDVLGEWEASCDGCGQQGRIEAMIIPVGTNSVSVPFVCGACKTEALAGRVVGEQA